jgi:hypothetical protein
MSKINMFAALSNKSASPMVADHVVADWKSQPASVKQIVAIARMYRSKDLLAISDNAVRTLVANTAIFDDETGQWPELAKLTKGQASDLLAGLKDLPKVGFSPVVTAAAEPITEPAPKAKKAKKARATKSETIVSPTLGIHETADGLRFEVYKTASGQVRTRMV